MLQNGFQFLNAHRLGDVVIHARGETLFAVPFHRIGGHGHNAKRRQPLFSFALPNPSRGFVAVHLGHVAIHENNIIRNLLERSEHLQAVRDNVGGITKSAQLLQRDFLVYGIVLGHQNTQMLGWSRLFHG